MTTRIENGAEIRGQLGVGVTPSPGVPFQILGGVVQQRLSLTAAAGVYTINVLAGNRFVTGAAIAGATTINLGNLESIPNGYEWEGKLVYAYTSGVITWFSGNTGFTVKWDGDAAKVPTPNSTETVIITVVGGTSIIEIAALRGRA
jgi:hypothetical protein